MEFIINGLISLVVIWFLIKQLIPVRGVSQIGTCDVKKILKDKGYQFIDVRTPYEFKTNHIHGFKNIPLPQIKQRHNELSKDKEVVVICQSGMRSNKATRILKKLGFAKITNVKGGMAAWRS
ncbi:rhodanese-like domain-containing protein [Oceanobacillus luteolus]|uniref:Rhodanese-like domain-containing protein n=1 Tax=Oceanobacillus luteolus TaxID=1274358 RepID=A0ABW4HSX0_9BACI